MEINLSLGHLISWAVMAYGASFFVKGDKLVRLVGWMALWQLLTPVRPMLIDLLLMFAGWRLQELIYLRVASRKET